ncbi:MAG: hypothetical protein GX558_11605, partial [Clostridiales bacterium]|nr:hypothetical protein [Clostridiales bacterium]
MNRALGVAAYCLHRQRRKLPVFLLVLLALAGASAAISLAAGQTVSMEYMGGGYKVGPSYAGAAMYAN